MVDYEDGLWALVLFQFQPELLFHRVKERNTADRVTRWRISSSREAALVPRSALTSAAASIFGGMELNVKAKSQAPSIPLSSNTG